ncbi:MAG: ABC transporter permease [Chitinophagaceae bacterium]|nr:ABC transporter permease [Chitinophagaceae bacterium]
MLAHYFVIAWRNLHRDKLFTLLNLLGLSTGLTCTLLIALWIKNEMAFGRFPDQSQLLLQVMANHPSPQGVTTIEATPGLLADALKAEIPGIDYATAVVHPGGLTGDKGILSAGNTHLEAKDICAGKDFLRLFPYPLLAGDRIRALDDPKGLLLSDELAFKLFHTASDVVGRTVDWNQSGLSGVYTIAGVFKKLADQPDQFDVVLSYDMFLAKNPKLLQWGNNEPATYLLVKAGTDLTRLNKRLEGFLQTRRKESKATLFSQPYNDRYLYNHYENGVPAGGRIAYLRLFLVIALFILLVACINFMNLSTAKAARRAKEIGIRKVIGAGRRGLIAQYLGESLVMAILALLLSVLFTLLLLPQFNAITGKQLVMDFSPQFLAFILLIAFAVGLIAGSYPALYLSGFKPGLILKGRLPGSTAELVTRKGLVIFQFAVSAFFIFCVFEINRQTEYIQRTDLGYSRDQLLYFDRGGMVTDNPADYQEGGRYELDLARMIQEIKTLSGVVNASNFRHNIVNRHGGTSDISWPGKRADEQIGFTDIAAGYDFIETLGIQLVAGRTFAREFGDEKAKIILNETAVKAMGLSDPLGKIVHVWGSDREIIGVTKDFHFESLYERIQPCFFDFTFNQRASKIMVKVRAGEMQQAITGLKRLYSKYNPGLQLDYHFLDQDYQALYQTETRMAVLSRYFTGLAIIISCLGLFGLAAFAAAKREKEIGVRKVLGASAFQILALLTRSFLQPVLIAIAIAFPLGWLVMHQWLQGFAYRIGISASTFFLSAGITMLLTLLTISFQTLKAAAARPVKILHNE